jgi:hypothetical protein
VAVVFNEFVADNSLVNDKLSTTANLLGDPGRAAILLRLMNGLALPYSAKCYSVTPSAREWFEAIGVDFPSSVAAQKKLAVRCLDWTERRHHLAGTLGVRDL